MAHSFGVKGGSATDFTEATPLLGNVDDDVFIRRGDATVSGFQVNVAELSIHWGLWTSSVSATSVRQNETPSEVQALNSFIMVSVAKAAETPIANIKGSVEFTTSNAFLASRNSEALGVQNVTGCFTLDLDASTNNVSGGTLNLCIGAAACESPSQVWERWQTSFSGHLADGKLEEVDLEDAIVISDGNTSAVQSGGNLFGVDSERPLGASLSGFLTGNSAEGFVAGFQIYDEIAGEDIPSNVIIGSTAFCLPRAISATEISQMTRQGFAVVGSHTSDSGINLGKTPDLGEGYDPLVGSTSPGFVLRPGDSSHIDYANEVNGFDLLWGRWMGDAGPLRYQYHLSDGSIFNEIIGEVIVASAVPSPLASLTGTHSRG
jgi:hypothetical protein